MSTQDKSKMLPDEFFPTVRAEELAAERQKAHDEIFAKLVTAEAQILAHRTGDHTMSWQPIETMPKNDIVILFCDERGNRWTDSASWGKSAAETGYPPTHWMPLPEPPQ